MEAGNDEMEEGKGAPPDLYRNKSANSPHPNNPKRNLGVMELSGSGKRKRSVRRSREYLCVSRLRYRRLLVFLWRRRFYSTFEALAMETRVFFRIAHLQRLARLGQWTDAIAYVFRFVPSVEMLGQVGRVFFSFLFVHRALDSIATGNPHGAAEARWHEFHLKDQPNLDPGSVKRGRLLLAMFHSQQLRASVNWQVVRLKAAEMAKNLLVQTPEFSDLLRLPTCRYKPHNILPIGSSSHRRRHVKKEGRIPASDLAKFYLQKKRRLPSFSHCEDSSLVPGLSWKSSSWLADIIDETVQAGIHPVLHDRHAFEDSCNEVLQAVFTSSKSPAKNSGIPSETNTGMKRPVITGDVGRQGFVARDNPKRPLLAVFQEFNPKRQQISGEFGQGGDYSRGDAGVRDAESNMKSLSAGSGDCSSPVEIQSS